MVRWRGGSVWGGGGIDGGGYVVFAVTESLGEHYEMLHGGVGGCTL